MSPLRDPDNAIRGPFSFHRIGALGIRCLRLFCAPSNAITPPAGASSADRTAIFALAALTRAASHSARAAAPSQSRGRDAFDLVPSSSEPSVKRKTQKKAPCPYVALPTFLEPSAKLNLQFKLKNDTRDSLIGNHAN